MGCGGWLLSFCDFGVVLSRTVLLLPGEGLTALTGCQWSRVFILKTVLSQTLHST